jgi:hypothetical protein
MSRWRPGSSVGCGIGAFASTTCVFGERNRRRTCRSAPFSKCRLLQHSSTRCGIGAFPSATGTCFLVQWHRTCRSTPFSQRKSYPHPSTHASIPVLARLPPLLHLHNRTVQHVLMMFSRYFVGVCSAVPARIALLYVATCVRVLRTGRCDGGSAEADVRFGPPMASGSGSLRMRLGFIL